MTYDGLAIAVCLFLMGLLAVQGINYLVDNHIKEMDEWATPSDGSRTTAWSPLRPWTTQGDCAMMGSLGQWKHGVSRPHPHRI